MQYQLVTTVKKKTLRARRKNENRGGRVSVNKKSSLSPSKLTISPYYYRLKD